MSESKHTPGPWRAIRAEDAEPPFGWLIVGPKGAIGYWRGHKDHHTDSNWLLTDADAALIAASPDLYAALADVHALVCEGADHGFNPSVGDWAERLFASNGKTSAALSAARGER